MKFERNEQDISPFGNILKLLQEISSSIEPHITNKIIKKRILVTW